MIWLGFWGTRLRPLSPFIILKGVRRLLLGPSSRSQHSRILRGARLSLHLFLSLCVSMWRSPTQSRILRSAGRLSLPLYLSLSLYVEQSIQPTAIDCPTRPSVYFSHGLISRLKNRRCREAGSTAIDPPTRPSVYFSHGLISR